jgi:transcription elongation GreA/GreB family factor
VVEETGREPDSDFERCVIDVLKASGYAVTPQLGVAGYRIDIAVEHPDHRGTYLAAIECDGATYHSAQSVRDRDRIRQEILESMGWRGRIWRIWSTDWFLSPRNQSAKLLDFLGALRETWRPDYVAGQSWIEEARRGLSEESARVREALIEEEEERAVTVGDTVKYVDLAKPNSILSAQITENKTDSAAGLYHRGTPFARTMIGAAVTAEVTLQLPGASSRTFRILEIQGPERS